MNDLLVTCMNGIVLYQHGKSRLVTHGTYYGLTWSKHHIYASFNPQHRNVTEIEVFDTNFLRIGKLSTSDLLGVHQIFYWDNELHVTNTSTDHIHVYSNNDICLFNWTGKNEDTRHLNSIWINNEYIYVIEGVQASLGGRPAIQVLTHQYKPVRRIYLMAALQIHNVYIENDILYTLGKYGLVRKHMKEKDYSVCDLRPDKTNGFLRGLARTKEFFYIGESEIKSRELRPYGDSRVLVLNNDCKIVDTIELKDTGQIMDVRVINDIDLAHNGIVLDCYVEGQQENCLPLE